MKTSEKIISYLKLKKQVSTKELVDHLGISRMAVFNQLRNLATVKREVQFMNELERRLNLVVKRISIVKIKSDVIVPQKTLNKLGDRIENG